MGERRRRLSRRFKGSFRGMERLGDIDLAFGAVLCSVVDHLMARTRRGLEFGNDLFSPSSLLLACHCSQLHSTLAGSPLDLCI